MRNPSLYSPRLYINIYIYIHMSALWYERVCVCSPTPTDYGIIQENRFVLRLEEAVVKQY